MTLSTCLKMLLCFQYSMVIHSTPSPMETTKSNLIEFLSVLVLFKKKNSNHPSTVLIMGVNKIPCHLLGVAHVFWGFQRHHRKGTGLFPALWMLDTASLVKCRLFTCGAGNGTKETNVFLSMGYYFLNPFSHNPRPEQLGWTDVTW